MPCLCQMWRTVPGVHLCVSPRGVCRLALDSAPGNSLGPSPPGTVRLPFSVSAGWHGFLRGALSQGGTCPFPVTFPSLMVDHSDRELERRSCLAGDQGCPGLRSPGLATGASVQSSLGSSEGFVPHGLQSVWADEDPFGGSSKLPWSQMTRVGAGCL